MGGEKVVPPSVLLVYRRPDCESVPSDVVSRPNQVRWTDVPATAIDGRVETDESDERSTGAPQPMSQAVCAVPRPTAAEKKRSPRHAIRFFIVIWVLAVWDWCRLTEAV